MGGTVKALAIAGGALHLLTWIAFVVASARLRYYQRIGRQLDRELEALNQKANHDHH
jgi:hypothetical protein